MRNALEVHQRFFDTTLAAEHFLDGTVSVGNRVGYRWSFLGVDMGAVPALLRHVLPWTPPMWSDVEAEPLTAFQDHSHDAHDLFVEEDGSWVCQVPAGWDATMDGQVVDGDVEITGKMEITRGDVTYRASIVPAPPAATRLQTEPDAPLLGTLGFLVAAGALFAMAVAFSPTPSSVGVVELDQRTVTLAIQVPEPPPEPKVEKVVEKVASSSGSRGAPAAPNEAPASDGPRSDVEVAQAAGLLTGGVLDAFDSALGGDLIAAAGALQGSQFGRGPAIGTLGGRRLGGGEVGGIGSIGRSGGSSSGHAYGGGTRKGQGAIARAGGEVVMVGSLQKSEIEAVIQKSLTSIRYCYQRRLQAQPELGGKIIVKFVVAADGSVSSSSVKKSSMGDAEVESCILGRFRRMTFPAPRGGGMAIVSYPFLFSPG